MKVTVAVMLAFGAWSTVTSLNVRSKRDANCPDNTEKRVVCYYGAWAGYKTEKEAVHIDDIDPSLCTHLIYSFMGIDEQTNKIKSLDEWMDFENGEYEEGGLGKLRKLKEQNENLKVMVAVGGWKEGQKGFSNMASSPSSRKAFIDSAKELVDKYDLDGIDIDWEYPNYGDGKPEDVENFTELLKELYQKFDADGKEVSAALGMGKNIRENSYNLREVAKNLHFMNLMTYDFKGSWDGETGHHAGMKEVEEALDYVLQEIDEKDRSKVVLGVGSSAQTFNAPGSQGQSGVKSSGGGEAGTSTKQQGFLAYSEICQKLNDGSFNMGGTSVDPVAYDGQTFAGFDTPATAANKCQMGMDKCIGGCMEWAIDNDDANNLCGDGKFPITRALKDTVLGDGVPSPISQLQPQMPEESIKENNAGGMPQSSNDQCNDGDLRAQPGNPHMFEVCISGNWMYPRSCPGGLCWNQAMMTCYHC